jgi:hypothetical protein
MDTSRAVAAQWTRLRADPFLKRVHTLIETAYRTPALRELYPYTEHLDLHFSRDHAEPYDYDLPYIQPLADGRYRVCAPEAGVTGVVVAEQEAVSLTVAALPADVREGAP